MYKGIYTAISGITGRQKQVDVISQNLANASTVGYKRDRVSFSTVMAESMAGGGEPSLLPYSKWLTVMSTPRPDLGQGELVRTGGETNIALEGQGFFAVQTPEGTRYTRCGDFRLDADRTMTTPAGYPLLGQSGPISIPLTSEPLVVDDNGRIFVDGVEVERLTVVDLKNARKAGGGLYVGEETESTALVKQGFLEESNVEPVKEMTDLVQALRLYEAGQRIIQSFDTLASKAVNDVGRAG